MVKINDLNFKRIKFSEITTNRFKKFKRETGLTPNVASRLALILSIAQDDLPSKELYLDKSGQEINRSTFLGDLESFLLSSYVLWCRKHNIVEMDLYDYLIVHINRGAELLVNRVKSIGDLKNIIS